MGADEGKLRTLKAFSKDRSVTLRLKAQESCIFEREEEKEEESPSLVTDVKGIWRVKNPLTG